MATHTGTFRANAVLTTGRWRHDRTYDHYGAESDLYVVTDTPLGPWPQYTPIHYVLEDALTRLIRLEGVTIRPATFTADAVLTGYHFMADAVLKKLSVSNSFTADAYIYTTHISSFTANAWFRAKGSFTANAVFV